MTKLQWKNEGGNMQKYKNSGGNSGVDEFEIGADFITVRFHNGSKLYTYSYQSAGVEKVEQMKRLALSGHGLNGYINTYARNDYVK